MLRYLVTLLSFELIHYRLHPRHFQSVFLMPQNPLQNFPVCLVVVATLPKGAPVCAPVSEDQANSPDYVPQAAATVSKNIKFQTELAVPKLPSMAARTLARLLYPEGTTRLVTRPFIISYHMNINNTDEPTLTTTSSPLFLIPKMWSC